MTNEQYLKNLEVPTGKIDVVLDTDAFNEVDDQYAISYMVRHSEKFNIKGICAAPFTNHLAATPAEGMQKSYDEIFKVLKLNGKEELGKLVHKGSDNYLPDEATSVESDAADFMANLANEYSPEKPLYIVAIGAITNVASAILKNPNIKENCVIVWLGGHAQHMPQPVYEFNMRQDIAAARIVFGCGAPLIQLPCKGVVDRFITTQWELVHWIVGKNELCDYLYDRTVKKAESYAKGLPWTRPIWDVTAVAWLLDTEGKFMESRLIPSPIPEYNREYTYDENRHLIRYVYRINRDELFDELFRVLGE